MLIYRAIQANSFDNVANDFECMIYLRIAQFWIVGIVIEQILHMVFGVVAKRGYQLDY